MSETASSPETPATESVDTSALDQSSESLDLARDALRTVAGNDDVTSADEQKETEISGEGEDAPQR